MKDLKLSNLLKRMWENLNFANINIKQPQLFYIIHLHSNSIVKKILIISILEFSISLLITYLSSKLKYTAEFLAIEKHSVLVFLDILYYLVFIYFFIQFIINFKKIDSSSNLQHLLKTIIKTRKSAYYLILSSLISLNLNTIIFFGIYLNTNHQLLLKTNESNSNLFLNNIVYCCILMLFLVIISFLIWHIYKLINLKLLTKQKLIFKELNN